MMKTIDNLMTWEVNILMIKCDVCNSVYNKGEEVLKVLGNDYYHLAYVCMNCVNDYINKYGITDEEVESTEISFIPTIVEVDAWR